jgi:hypothetical protein
MNVEKDMSIKNDMSIQIDMVIHGKGQTLSPTATRTSTTSPALQRQGTMHSSHVDVVQVALGPRGPVHGALRPRGTHPRHFFQPCTASMSANGPLHSIDISKFTHTLQIPTNSRPRTPSCTPSRTPSRTPYSNSPTSYTFTPNLFILILALLRF